MSAIGPVATIALAAGILDEPITAVQILGAALVLGGVWPGPSAFPDLASPTAPNRSLHCFTR